MSAEAGKSAAKAQQQHEQLKQLNRPETPSRTFPKILSHIAKTPPTDVKHPSNGVPEEDSKEDRSSDSEDPAENRPTRRQSKMIQSSDYVIGLDQLQEQVRRLALRRGFTLNIMVVGKSRYLHHPSISDLHYFLFSKGRSGLGKSTLINTLFRSTVLPLASGIQPTKTTEIRTTQTGFYIVFLIYISFKFGNLLLI